MFLQIIKDPQTHRFAFEAALLLALIANFHRTDAAKLNPCLRSVKEVDDREFFRQLCNAATFTLNAVIKWDFPSPH